MSELHIFEDDRNNSTLGYDYARNLRVRPGTSSGITKFSEHEADGCEAQECERLAIEVRPIFGKPSASVEPSNGTLDHPTAW